MKIGHLEGQAHSNGNSMKVPSSMLDAMSHLQMDSKLPTAGNTGQGFSNAAALKETMTVTSGARTLEQMPGDGNNGGVNTNHTNATYTKQHNGGGLSHNPSAYEMQQNHSSFTTQTYH